MDDAGHGIACEPFDAHSQHARSARRGSREDGVKISVESHDHTSFVKRTCEDVLVRCRRQTDVARVDGVVTEREKRGRRAARQALVEQELQPSSRSGKVHDPVVDERLRVREDLANVLFFELRILAKEGGSVGIRPKRLEHALDRDSQISNARLPTETRWIGRDAVERHERSVADGGRRPSASTFPTSCAQFLEPFADGPRMLIPNGVAPSRLAACLPISRASA